MPLFAAKKTKSQVQITEALTKGEQAATATRKKAVKKSLAKLGIPCSLDKIPNIAVLGSGGGLRAMIALYGTLTQLKKCKLLDCVMYLSGVSGSTWCMSSLNKTDDWSEKVEKLEKCECVKLTKDHWDSKKASCILVEASKDENYSLTDFWAYFVVCGMLKEIDESKLSDQRKPCENGKNPYPIYAAVDKETYSQHEAGSWFEFTAHNAGVLGINGNHSMGAYVDMKELGSVFSEGQLKKKKEEKTICYLRGLWGSAIASIEEIIKTITEALLHFLHQEKARYFATHSKHPHHQKLLTLCKAYKHVLKLQLCVSDGETLRALGRFYFLEDVLKSHQNSESCKLLKEMRHTRPSSNVAERRKACLKLWEALHQDFGQPAEEMEMPGWIECVYKTGCCILTWTWGTTSNFVHKIPDVKLPNLRSKEVVSLIDAGLAINSAYPLVLHPERKMKLILSFDFSAGNPFQTLISAADFCRIRGIKFPVIDVDVDHDKDNPNDCYIFRGDDLTVMHFPLFNRVNCQGKIAEYRDTFSTFKLSYTEKELEKLLTAAKKNVEDVQQKIREEIKCIVASSSKKD